jgi:hypothetical protein
MQCATLKDIPRAQRSRLMAGKLSLHSVGIEYVALSVQRISLLDADQFPRIVRFGFLE